MILQLHLHSLRGALAAHLGRVGLRSLIVDRGHALVRVAVEVVDTMVDLVLRMMLLMSPLPLIDI